MPKQQIPLAHHLSNPPQLRLKQLQFLTHQLQLQLKMNTHSQNDSFSKHQCNEAHTQR
ncbi:hypothetical protein HanHA300_Chr01g0024891 [Helianthus annuus]|nr:hypothetical protein HanHA300_Chr01g0024891 [Helianthus annuus]KAJ0627539.1 hypothetical protein HanHA89_Chr01g0026931 [Helianthus annuus]KAJ0783846.1 hypothetical protein HanLR1_Chr01g0025531 [Helianthus annuus]